METRFSIGDTVHLGGCEGVVIEGALASGGSAQFTTGDGVMTAVVFKAREPDVSLVNARVWLVQEVLGGEAQPRYALMVDDGYWGLRIQPCAFAAPPFDEVFVMGYRLSGMVLEDGVAVAEANVSLEVRLATQEDGEVVLWDSEEYNELIYSSSLGTWVSGPEVLAPIRTDQQGEWETIVPKGHGAVYQRGTDLRDDSTQTQERPPSRHVLRIDAVYRGRRAQAAEGTVATINVDSASLEITGTPGAYLRVGSVDDMGSVYLVPPSGEVDITGLPRGEHSIVQFKRTPWGGWDSGWGCPRKIVWAEPGTVTSVTMAAMEEYDTGGDTIAGRVYERPGVPAAGIAITIIDTETCEVIGTAATTDDGGFWSAEIPETGFGGDLYVHDASWGSLPVLGWPYSDIVLGARAYSSWFDEFRPEAWRKGSFGHKNFPYVPESLWVEDAQTGEEFATAEVVYGGWITEATLPMYRYVSDIETLVDEGPELRTYDIVDADGIVESGFILGTQPFESYETPPGMFRASGYYPEAKHLIGGKTHGNVLLHSDERVDEALPEAARFGLEFGTLKPFAEVRSAKRSETCDVTSFAGLLCPYCGGPTWRDPTSGGGTQGYCRQCAAAFGIPTAMDARTYFRSPTVGARWDRTQRAVLAFWDEQMPRKVERHWRPDVYDETDDFVTQSGAGQPTNAPRWFAKHVDEFGDGKGFGEFDGDATPMYIPGHDIAYFGALPEIDRDLGLAQLKLILEPDYVLPIALTLDIDCILQTGEIETVQVVAVAGLTGPGSSNPFGDAVRLIDVAKMKAELCAAPYRGVGLYRGVTDIRLVEPPTAPGCRFTVVGDTPFLASPEGIPLKARSSTPVALQVDRPWGNPHLTDDAVGQVFLTYADEGDIRLHRRAGLVDEWDAGDTVASDGISDYPCVTKDSAGTLVMMRQRGVSTTQLDVSRDDGRELG